MIDINSIIQTLSDEKIIQLVTELGSDDYKDTPTAIIFKTICHNINPEDASMKLYYYKSNKLFHCYTGCGESFNIIGLFKKRYELLGINYNFYKDILLKLTNNQSLITKTTFFRPYESDFEKYNHSEIKVTLPKLKPYLLNVYNFFPVPEWIADGINEETMKTFNIRYDIKNNRVIIPHYDIQGNLIGIRGRALNEEDVELGKYRPVEIEGKIYKHPLGYNLYGLNLVKENISRYKTALIAEGEKSVLQYNTMYGFNRNICVAACGSSIQSYQIDLLKSAGAQTIIICFDKEGQDWSEKERYYQKLKTICLKYRNKCRMGFVWDSGDLLNLKDSPFDKGAEIFEKLYKGAIYI